MAAANAQPKNQEFNFVTFFHKFFKHNKETVELEKKSNLKDILPQTLQYSKSMYLALVSYCEDYSCVVADK